MMRRTILAIAILGSPLGAFAAEPSKADPASIEFFESKVRPLLAEHCHGCHGPKKQQAGLRLDTSTGMKQGSDSGPVVLPGDPMKSVLMRSVRREGDAPMPPKAPLPAEAVNVLTQWVKTGAVFPEDRIATPSGPDPKKHWAFQPVRDPALPTVKGEAPSPVDRFVLAKLEDKGATYALAADKRTLLRRVTFDLIGLPPTAEELAGFEADRSPQAFAKVVDRLLASPRYGERWARHWLDIARYADTKGYVFREDRNYPFAYTYRDYVIRAFNDDKPYDRFLLEQIAADRLDLKDKTSLAAMGFLTVGRRFLNNVHDVIDDRLDTIGRGLQGLTIGCARCHDHKFDPIPSRDYYSLYGILRSSMEPKELPLIGEASKVPEAKAFLAEFAMKQQALDDLIETRRMAEVKRLQSPEVAAAYLGVDFEVRAKNGDAQALLRSRELNSIIFTRWRNHISEELKAKPSIFATLAALAAIPEKDFLAKLEPTLTQGIGRFDAETVKAIQAEKPKTFKESLTVLAKLLATSPTGSALAKAYAAGGPTDLSTDDFEKIRNRADRDAITDAAAKLDKFMASSPYAPPRAMVMQDGDPFPSYVFLRGSPDNHGPPAPKQFLEILSGPDRKPFTDGSGRLELARAIASADNPLTARVWANRVWAYHFGEGLVRTPSDFGVRTELPTHPELLDWLAKRLVDSGWSTKSLHRAILLSRAYQQSSTGPLADPENRLLSRQNRQRLDFESLRDSMLAVSGQLDPTMGGRPVDLFKAPLPKRRSVYAFIDRQNVPGTFRVFDVASTDQHSPQRYQTTVPQQALFLMNSPFATEQAKALIAQPVFRNGKGTEHKIDRLYRILFTRKPTPDERSVAKEFLAGAGAEPHAIFGPWEQLAQVLLLSNEFAFVD